MGAHWVEEACVTCTILSSAGKAQAAVAEAGCEACQSYVKAVLADRRAPSDQSSLCPAWQLCPGSGNFPLMVIDSGQPELEWQRVSRRTEVIQVQEEESRAQRNSSEWTRGGGHSADVWAIVMAHMSKSWPEQGGLGWRAWPLFSQVEVPVSLGTKWEGVGRCGCDCPDVLPLGPSTTDLDFLRLPKAWCGWNLDSCERLLHLPQVPGGCTMLLLQLTFRQGWPCYCFGARTLN